MYSKDGSLHYIKIYLRLRDGASRPRCCTVDLMGYLLQHIFCKVLEFLVLVLLPVTAALASCEILSLPIRDGRLNALWLLPTEFVKYRRRAQ